MFRTTRTLVAALAAFAFTAGVTAALGAEDTPAKDKAAAKAAAGEKDGAKVEVATAFRSGDLIGMNVRNRQGKDLGKIEDLVVELQTGEVRYAALSFGGFAGFGDKLFAVPWDRLTYKFGEDDRHFIFDATQQDLEKAPGFDQNNWPDVADASFSTSIDKYYKVDRTKKEVTEKPTVEKKTNAPIVYDAVFRASKLKGLNVRNPRGEDLGNVQEIVIDLKNAHIKYYALSFGGFAGFGNKLFAIPPHALTLKHASDETFFVSDMSPTRLKDAPGFDQDHWPDTADPKWSMEIDKFYGERAAEKRTTTSNK